MVKKISLFLAIFILGISQLSFAMSCGSQEHKGYQQLAQSSAGDTAKTEAVNVGNKICPVMGGEIDPKITYEHKGKIYNFCCPECIDEFKKNPEKYIKKVEGEFRNRAQTEGREKPDAATAATHPMQHEEGMSQKGHARHGE